ncbi:MAG: hypothetical protein H7224_05970 [Polaromonas sp.]|nr:hypothetical protein [Polaromonas sp.]
MDSFFLAALLAFGLYLLKMKDQRRRVVLLATQLGQFQIEKLMETVTSGYLRALGESDGVRREQIWQLLATTEDQLAEQFKRFSTDFAKLDEAQTRVSRIPVAVPFADQLFPQTTFDLRRAIAIHAEGLAEACRNDAGRSHRDKAFTVSAELFLMQHTCHWFCRSKTTASARLLARHQTPYAQVVASVGAGTRKAYSALIGS